jgi:hypothetical protein
MTLRLYVGTVVCNSQAICENCEGAKMGNQHQQKPETDHNRKRPLKVSEGETQMAAPNRALPLSPSAIIKLQRTIGNQAVMRLLNPDPSSTADADGVTQQKSDAPAKQSDKAGDASEMSDEFLDSATFWEQLQGDVKQRYHIWLTRLVNQLSAFRADMGETGESNVWANAFKAWLGPLGTVGDVMVAVMETADAIHESVPKGKRLSLGDFSNEITKNIDIQLQQLQLSVPDLPVFVTLRKNKSAEKTRLPEQLRDRRRSARDEVENALSKLPNPETLRKDWITEWIRGAQEDDWFDDENQPGTIVYSTVYLFNGFSVGSRGSKISQEANADVVNGLSSLVNIGRAYIEDVAKPEGTKQALIGAYGAETPLHELPLSFTLRLYGKTQHHFDLALVCEKKFYRDGWTALGGKRYGFSEDLLSHWLTKGRKPTIADLVADE